MSFQELNRMNITGDTKYVNWINRLLMKLDNEYGTEYQQTESVKKLLEESVECHSEHQI